MGRHLQQRDFSRRPVEVVGNVLLIERINNDTRHSNVMIFHHCSSAECRFRSFSLAFTDAVDIDVLARLEKLDDQAGVTTFVDLLATLEHDG